MTTTASADKFDRWGKLAFAIVVVASFGDFLRYSTIEGPVWTVPVVFVCGALYAVLGVFDVASGTACRGRPVAVYFLVQFSLVAAMVLISPVRGFFAIVTMPLASQAVLSLGWRWTSVIVAGLFAVCVAALWLAYGSTIALQSAPSYLTAFVFTVVFSVVTRDAVAAREKAERLSAELAGANEQLKTYAAQAAAVATTGERNRLAREIHDGIGHYLTTINVQLEAARAVCARQPAQASAALENAARLSREALDEVRRSVGTLRADVPRPPLPQTLQSLARDLGLEVGIQLVGAVRPLPAPVELALYRSAQEGLTNVCKHAQATRTELRLDFSAPDHVTLTIADDGRGSRGDAPWPGYGIAGLRERIELLGGTMAVANQPVRGFVLTVQVPA